jgi:hypothetical protein
LQKIPKIENFGAEVVKKENSERERVGAEKDEHRGHRGNGGPQRKDV